MLVVLDIELVSQAAGEEDKGRGKGGYTFLTKDEELLFLFPYSVLIVKDA